MRTLTYRKTEGDRSDARRRRSGFTLVELLIVMAILVLLVSLVGPRLLGSKKKADIGATRTQIGLFEASLERYALDMNTFPSTEQGLQALVSASSTSSLSTPVAGVDSFENEDLGLPGESVAPAGGSGSRWDGPYLRKTEVPRDPWGNMYQYEYPPTHGSGDQPDIWSYGPDGQDGTEDDIHNWTGAGTGTGMETEGFPDDVEPMLPEEPPIQ